MSVSDHHSALAGSSRLVTPKVFRVGDERGDGFLRLFVDQQLKISRRLRHLVGVGQQKAIGFARQIAKVVSAREQQSNKNGEPGIGAENRGCQLSVVIHINFPFCSHNAERGSPAGPETADLSGPALSEEMAG